MKDQDFVNIIDVIPDAVICLKYATNDNFVGERFYSSPDAYLRYGTAKKLIRAADILREQGCRIKIWDAYRPAAAQFRLWEILPDSDYVANPNICFSCHTRGNAVDITLTDTNGNELEMPSAFDEFSDKANRDYSDATATSRANAEALEKAMKESGFVEYYEEWWHYEDTVDYPPEQDLFSKM